MNQFTIFKTQDLAKSDFNFDTGDKSENDDSWQVTNLFARKEECDSACCALRLTDNSWFCASVLAQTRGDTIWQSLIFCTSRDEAKA